MPTLTTLPTLPASCPMFVPPCLLLLLCLAAHPTHNTPVMPTGRVQRLYGGVVQRHWGLHSHHHGRQCRRAARGPAHQGPHPAASVSATEQGQNDDTGQSTGGMCVCVCVCVCAVSCCSCSSPHTFVLLYVQADLNELFSGLPFEIETRYPLILNTLFTTMLYR